MKTKMKDELLRILLNKASKLGARGFEVTDWVPPETAASDPRGTLIYHAPAPTSATERSWYER